MGSQRTGGLTYPAVERRRVPLERTDESGGEPSRSQREPGLRHGGRVLFPHGSGLRTRAFYSEYMLITRSIEREHTRQYFVGLRVNMMQSASER